MSTHLKAIAFGALLVTQETMTHAKGSNYSPVATALDAYDGNVQVTRTQNVNMKKRGTYTDTFEARDSSGNVTRHIRTIIVK